MYEGLSDGVFGTPGSWNFRRCDNRQCRILWLDPAPREEGIEEIYKGYYTHDIEQSKSGRPFLRAAYRLIAEAYLSNRLGYPFHESSVAKLLGYLLYLHPGRRAYIDYSVFYLPFLSSGKLLEVGCGAGTTLKLMKDYGWEVQGIDFDPLAVKAARARGVDVYVGTLGDRAFPGASFDAVVSSNLVEHLHDPLAFFKESYRLLKAGGRAVMVTPNANSFGHLLFGKTWRGLEPPRHLQVFTPISIASLLSTAGFRNCKMFTSVSHTYAHFIGSLPRNLQTGSLPKELSIRMWGRLMQLLELIIMRAGCKKGGVIVAIAEK